MLVKDANGMSFKAGIWINLIISFLCQGGGVVGDLMVNPLCHVDIHPVFYMTKKSTDMLHQLERGNKLLPI